MNAYIQTVIGSRHWAIHPPEFSALMAGMDRLPEARQVDTSIRPPAGYYVLDGVAKIMVVGPLMKNVPAFFRQIGICATSYLDIVEHIGKAVNDPTVSRIELLVDSPGGTVAGVDTAANAIYQARDKKHITAIVDGMCCSGGYWVASQAHTMIATPTSLIGSIGVFHIIEDTSEAYAQQGVKIHVFRSSELKGTGIPGTPLTENQAREEQNLVNAFARMFTAAVATGRGVTEEKANAWATGQVFIAQEAKHIGLVDGVVTVQNTATDRSEIMTKKAMATVTPADDDVTEEEETEEVATTDDTTDVAPDTEDVQGNDDVTPDDDTTEETTDETTDENPDPEQGGDVPDSTDSPDDAGQTITEDGTEDEPEEKENPANVKELRTYFAEYPAFILDQLEKGNTMTAAKIEFAEMMLAKHQPKVKGAPAVTYGEAQKSGKDFWTLVDEKVKQGMNKCHAMSAVHREHPGIAVGPRK